MTPAAKPSVKKDEVSEKPSEPAAAKGVEPSKKDEKPGAAAAADDKTTPAGKVEEKPKDTKKKPPSVRAQLDVILLVPIQGAYEPLFLLSICTVSL